MARKYFFSVLPTWFSFNVCLVLSSPPSRCFFLVLFVGICVPMQGPSCSPACFFQPAFFQHLACVTFGTAKWGCMRVGQTHRTTEWFAFGASLLQFWFLARSDVAIQARLNKLWVHIRCRRGALTLGMSSQDARANQNPCVEGEGSET